MGRGRRGRGKLVSKELNVLAKDTVPKKEDNGKFVNYVMNVIFNRLQQHCRLKQEEWMDDPDYEKYSLDRIRVVGSSGKGTEIRLFSDYDCVLFVNNRDPDEFEEVIEDFEDILLHHVDRFSISNVHTTSHSVKFNLDIGQATVKFDFLPATNLLLGINRNELNLGLEQGKRALRIIQNSNNRTEALKQYSSSLCELQVEFVKSQTPFVKDVVRLAKLWNKTIHLLEDDGDKIYINGRSCLIEAIAIEAGRDVEERFNEGEGLEKNKLFNGFKRFLTYMTQFGTLNIIMNDYLNKIGFSTPPQYILDQEPLVLDPSNPYNNLAHDVDEDVIDMFEEYAKETKERLLSYRSGDMDLYRVFDPQPEQDYVYDNEWKVDEILGEKEFISSEEGNFLFSLTGLRL